MDQKNLVRRSGDIAYWNMINNSILSILSEKDNLVTYRKKFIRNLRCCSEIIEEMI
jgi:hypothetical protein